MKARIVFHELAVVELQEAAQYYDLESKGLGKVFIEQIETTILLISEYPESAPFINDIVRRMIVPRFPYSILYSVTSDRVLILAIANQKRRPYYWRSRG